MPADMIRIAALLLAIAIPGAVPVTQALAQENSGGGLMGFATDPDAPVQIESDTLEVHDKEHTAIFIGNVLTVQGETRMRSDRLKANYAPSGQQAAAAAPAAEEPVEGEEEAAQSTSLLSGPGSKIKDLYASGNVHVLSKDDQSADGQWAHYTVEDRKIVMGDDVVLRQRTNVVKGTKLFIDLNTGQSRIVGGATVDATQKKGRVRALFESPPKGEQNKTPQN